MSYKVVQFFKTVFYILAFLTFVVCAFSPIARADRFLISASSNVASVKSMQVKAMEMEIEEQVALRGLSIVKRLSSGSVVVLASPDQMEAMSSVLGSDSILVERDIRIQIPIDEVSSTQVEFSALNSQIVPWGIMRVRGAGVMDGRGEGVVVCVSDTGIDLDHPDLQANIVGDFNTINPALSGDDDNNHGTHVAGTIAALNNDFGVVGVAPKAKLIAAKGLDAGGGGFLSDLIETVDGCRTRGADIINMSWGGGGFSAALNEALQRAENAGIINVAAAGNGSNGDNARAPVAFPAAYNAVIAVSATTPLDLIAFFSNAGPQVELSAPGVNVLSTIVGGQYQAFSGTSMAAPHVAGVAALMRSRSPEATRAQLFGTSLGLVASYQGTRGLASAVLNTYR